MHFGSAIVEGAHEAIAVALQELQRCLAVPSATHPEPQLSVLDLRRLQRHGAAGSVQEHAIEWSVGLGDFEPVDTIRVLPGAGEVPPAGEVLPRIGRGERDERGSNSDGDQQTHVGSLSMPECYQTVR